MAHNKKEDRICYICKCKIKGNYITYLPKGDTICSNDCLIEYRKNEK